MRLALQLKGLSYVCQPIDLLSGEQQRAEYARLNPSCAVPTLVVSFDETEQRLVIGQSNAILEWLEETHPQPCPLLPAEANSRAKVRQLVALLVADTQPLANLSVLDHVQQLTGSAEERKRWGTASAPPTPVSAPPPLCLHPPSLTVVAAAALLL